MRVALGLEYRGTAYCGWQSQLSACGVQDFVEKAIAVFLGTSVRVICAGRTDTGVHARAQVAHLDTDIDRTEQSWVRGLNTNLPSDIRVLWAKKFADLLGQRDEECFHARFSASARAYQYLLLNDPVAPGIDAANVGWFHAPLDAVSMQTAAAYLLGEHDFSAFRAAECQAKTPIKVMHAAAVRRLGAIIIFDFRASAFLHHMVRNIVGSLVYVGAGKQDATWFAHVLASKDRARCAPTFSPNGLYLTSVEYDEIWQLPKFPARSVAEVQLWN
ncbi:MAG: tRNA pseudouridine(38-40) synthase TruA [Aeromicrobium sp.]|nr:tRNA pseudouridine(38-40) synthase TruA [Burkholderiales bacterium]